MTQRQKGKTWAMSSRLLLVALLLASTLAIFPSVSGDSGVTATNQSKIPVLLQDSHPPVLIQSDADFVSQGWPGSGTNVSPYVISGLRFNGEPMPYINVSHVTATFVIRNCSLLRDSYSSYSIWLEDIFVQDARAFSVINCTFAGIPPTNEYHTDVVAYAENVSVIDNTISSRGWLFVMASNRIDFSMNDVSGPIYPYFESKEVHIVGNSFSDIKDGLRLPSLLLSGQLRSLEVSHNNFTDGGLAVDMYGYAFKIGTFEDNYVMNRPILVVNQRGGQIDCGPYAQVICYDCTDLTLFGGGYHDVACGVGVCFCHNCSVLNGEFDSCYLGIWSYFCERVRIQNVVAVSCDQAISLLQCDYVRVIDCSLRGGSMGLSMDECDLPVITNNTFVRNSQEGAFLSGCRGATVSGNLFKENGRNALDYSGFYDTWDGNAWDDYFGIGAYVVTGPPDDMWTIVDHNPKSTSPWSMLPLTPVLPVSALFVCLLSVAYLLSRRWKGAFASLLGTRNNQLFILYVVEVLTLPVVFRIYPGVNWEQTNGYWMLRSIGIREWSQSGQLYATAGAGAGVGGAYLPLLVIVLLIAWNAWRLEKNGASLSLRVVNLIVLLAFSIFLADFLYPSFYPYSGVVDIPLPLSPLLVFITLRYVKRTTSGKTAPANKAVPETPASSDTLPTG